ncbi:MAG: vacuolar iron transporter family protein [Gaiellaceae bacterium]|jgi:VIT1/CCC1 family predicted Fe2+/Mn2+ transporter|nr:vacuolar iron transporter family protein [Gaiellaceae bacterium]
MALDTPVTAESRAIAVAHIRDHSLGEAERIARLSRIREFVLGAQDGLLVPLGVVTGMAAAHPGRTLIIVAGLAEAVAGAVAMGSGSFLASEAEERLYEAEIRDEGAEIADHPERETAELALILEREGLPRPQAEQVALGLAANPNVFLRTKVQKELGLSPDAGGAALGDALVVGGTYLCAAIVPLWPYLVLPLTAALVASLICTLLALFALGVFKGRLARMTILTSGLQVAIIGSLSAGLGFAIGRIVNAIAG